MEHHKTHTDKGEKIWIKDKKNEITYAVVAYEERRMHRNYRVFWHYKIEKYNKWCDSKTCRSCKRKLNMFFWKVMARTMAFLLPRHPHIGNYPHSPHSFSVHLLNCYFPDFPACHIAEKFMKCSCFLNPANTTDERVNFHSTM